MFVSGCSFTSALFSDVVLVVMGAIFVLGIVFDVPFEDLLSALRLDEGSLHFLRQKFS